MPRAWPSPEQQIGAKIRLKWRRIPGLLNEMPWKGLGSLRGEGKFRDASELIFSRLFDWQEDTFWLDR